MDPLRLAIAGCTGRMGQTLMRLIHADPRFELVGAATATEDQQLGADAGGMAGIGDVGVPVEANLDVDCDALIEFTLPDGPGEWATWCGDRGVALISGTTGLSDADWSALRQASESIPIVWAPNMSVGVNLMLALVEDLARKLDEAWDIEILEAHHRRKIDAPSGTARALLEAVCEGRGLDPQDAAVHGRAGRCGPRDARQIGVHALRMGSIVGEHEVHFSCDAEALTLRHRAFSRETFATGALRAALWLRGRSPGLYTMRDVLFG